MSKTKLPKDSKGRTILGEQYGITITRPWNEAMYKHNEEVAAQMKADISSALEKAYKAKDEMNVTIIARAINAYGYGSGMDLQDIYEDAVNGLDRIVLHWLDDNTWPELVKAGLVKQVSKQIIGFKK